MLDRRSRDLLPVLLITTHLAGCVSVSTVPYETSVRPAKPADYPIEILEASSIRKAYRVIGAVQVEVGKLHSTSGAMERLRAAARSMGGDALVDLSHQPIGGGSTSQGTGFYSGHLRDLWTAKVIVWEQ